MFLYFCDTEMNEFDFLPRFAAVAEE